MSLKKKILKKSLLWLFLKKGQKKSCKMQNIRNLFNRPKVFIQGYITVKKS